MPSMKKKPKKRKNTTRQSARSNKTDAGGISSLISFALSLYEQGDAHGAKKEFLIILKKQPGNADALYNLGIILKEQGKVDEAIKYYEKVLSVDPGYVNAHFNIGGIYINQAKYDEAYKKFRKVVSLSPDYINAYFNLGIIAGAQGKNNEAINYYKKVLSMDPGYVNAYYNIGIMLMNQNRNDEAVKYFKKAVLVDPGHVDALFNIGSAKQNMNDFEGALGFYEKTLKIRPDYYLAHNNMGIIYQSENKLEKALECYEKAVRINPEYSGPYMNMGNVYRDLGNVEKTIENYKKSISIEPSLIGYNNLCGYQKDLCNYEEVRHLTFKMLEYKNQKKSVLASIHDSLIQTCEWEKAGSVIERFKKAEMDPEARDVLAGSFMEFCAITDLSLDEISEQHKIWGRLTEQNIMPFEHNMWKSRHPMTGKIRIGYSSPDLREHSVGYLIKDIIASHNRAEFEIYCYANFDPKDMDSFSQEIINSSNMFKYVKHLSDKKMAEEIYNDEIDILVDLSGYTAGHRLRAFAYKPAPIQITYLGYPNTTGLSRMDYRTTDRFAESGEEYDYRYSEKLIRLTNCFLSFNGFGDVVPAQIKGHRRGGIIFGCFNNIQKLTPKAVELWSKILKEVDGSELHLKAKQLNTGFIWDNIVREFAKHGIPEERVKCLGYTATREEHLRLYNSIDISLDTFPYNGTVTTLEALWMNIPVITLVGESHAQRVSYSILKNLNLDQLIAFTGEEYVSKSTELAENPETIRELKTKMRKNLLASSICNPKVITREMELNFKRIWMEYQETGVRRQETEDRRQRTEDGGQETGNRKQKEEDVIGDAISAASRLRMAMVKLEVGEFSQAAEISSSLIGEESLSPLAWHLLGVSKHRLGKEEEAIDALGKSLSLNANNPGARELMEEICRQGIGSEPRH